MKNGCATAFKREKMLKDSWDITTFAQLRQAANDIAAHLSQYGGIIALHGDLGAGKTTLVQSIALALGITQPVASPTFALVLEYPLPDGRSLVHMDLYRLSGLADLDSIGFEEYLDSGAISPLGVRSRSRR